MPPCGATPASRAPPTARPATAVPSAAASANGACAFPPGSMRACGAPGKTDLPGVPMTHTDSLAAPGMAATLAARGRRVTDAPTRMFHWLFALSFAGGWLTAESEHWRALHVTLGYTMAGLLGFRLVYG